MHTNLQFANEQTVSARMPKDLYLMKSNWNLWQKTSDAVDIYCGGFFFSTSVFKSCATTSAWDKRKPHLMSKCCLLSSHLPDDTQLSHVHALMNTHIHTSQSQITNKVSSISKCLSSFGTELKSINSWSVVKNKNSPNAVCVKGSKSTSMNLTTFFSVPGTKQVQVLQWVS